MKNKLIQLPDGYLNRTPMFQFILVSLLFPLWAMAASLNDILIAQFKHVFALSDLASSFVQSAFYGGYFLVAIPASLVIKRTNYKFAILTGLLFYIVGCSLFFPASHMATYTMFLGAIFAIAIGLGFLETAANTYSTMIGPRQYNVLRLNISQTFNPVGSIAGILLGKFLVFQEGASLEAQMANMSPSQAKAFGLSMLQHTLSPYKYIIFVLIAIFIVFLFTKFPDCKPMERSGKKERRPRVTETLAYLARNVAFRKGIVAQFLYVGMQVAVWSFTIRLVLHLKPEINERTASNFMIYGFIAFFVGKFVANFLMTRLRPALVLFGYSVIGSLLLLYVVLVPNMTAVYAAVAVSFMFGPCWATIYAETLEAVTEKKYTETAGAILVMAIIGGAVVPAIQGYVSDLVGSVQIAFFVSMLCFVYVGVYFFSEMKKKQAPSTSVRKVS
ncbi:L-fucose transporter [Fictibacillus macauensis ZFHKF-1]|uniref:L-fucose transporter n=1 Tax=Fictibacillus macauensis ZFHKF-1 TaxID=1196324 RepID=I8AGP1_9BACL|nr:L-fucose:H+ symporter permease [Fictibacillus macauensis]EIT84847.1 L-fucose transporter [Fictibacillus macauensis ZFHKF-1]